MLIQKTKQWLRSLHRLRMRADLSVGENIRSILWSVWTEDTKERKCAHRRFVFIFQTGSLFDCLTKSFFIATSHKHRLPAVPTNCLLGYGSKMNIALIKYHSMISPLIDVRTDGRAGEGNVGRFGHLCLYRVAWIVSRVSCIGLSVVIRNWRSARSA